jgi:putative phage-type endonuclease
VVVVVDGQSPVVQLGGNLIECGSEEEWFRVRSTGVTGSDASKIAAANKYGSAFELWCEKTAKLNYAELVAEDEEQELNEPAHWGIVLEPVIRAEFVRRTGLQVIEDPKWSIRQHPEFPWCLGSLDGHVVVPGRGVGVWECKTAGFYQRDIWNVGVPASYLVQAMHYMAVTGYKFVIFAALIGGQMYKQHLVERDDAFIELLLDAEAQFYGAVQTKTPVAIDGHEATTRAIHTIYPSDNGDSIELPAMADEWDRLRTEAIEKQKEATIDRTKYENLIKESLGNACYGGTPSGVRYSWKGSPTRRLNRLTR